MSRNAVVATLMVALLFAGVNLATGQSNDPSAEDHALSTAGSMIVAGHAFSAIRYSRRVKISPTGKQQFIRNEYYPILIARDSEGRVRVQSVSNPPLECDQLQSLVPPPCPAWGVILFDPVTQTITHWTEGEIAGHAAIKVKLSAQQVEEAEKATSIITADPPDTNQDIKQVTTENLGAKVIEGISVTGIRTTTTFPVQPPNQERPTINVHEVWISEDMKLIVQIVDGDPQNEETLSGLDHISLQPDPTLFHPPDGYEIQYPRTVGKYVDSDMGDVDEWFVGRTANTSTR
jgi:hypothetical protein